MIKPSRADINRKLRRTRKDMAEAKKWRDIFFNVMFPLGLASSFGWVITHKIFEVVYLSYAAPFWSLSRRLRNASFRGEK